MPEKIILASGSPRRRELLSRMGVGFEAYPVDADERCDAPVKERVLELARRKAALCAEAFSRGTVLGADTLVALDGEVMGKPRDREDALRMLRALSGRTHEVLTGVCLIDAATGRERAQADETRITFRALSEDEIKAYVDSGDPMDKAGAYGIQSGAGAFVEKIDGSYENVMGLPVDMVADMLARFGEAGRDD